MAGHLLKPTVHVEVLVKDADFTSLMCKEIRGSVEDKLRETYASVTVNQVMDGLDDLAHEKHIARIEVVDYTGPATSTGIYNLQDVQLDVRPYVLKGTEPRRSIKQSYEEYGNPIHLLDMPNATLHNEWNSLVFDDALPSCLLRYLVRMTAMMKQTGIDRKTFNWNRLCLLHGPPGSGKSTLCRALAQKLSIRLGDILPESCLAEINANAMLSKYFGESGKLIKATCDDIASVAQKRDVLVCVVIDEVETIAGSRERLTNRNECQDGLRATNQLLTALDRFRELPNILVLCTSNLVEAIDPAFLDRVDIKQRIPSPSPKAIYNIFQSCLNELVRSGVVDNASLPVPSEVGSAARATASPSGGSPLREPMMRSIRADTELVEAASSSSSSSLEPSTRTPASAIPSFSEMMVRKLTNPNLPGCRLWALTQKCQGFSGRTLRRLPILGLAMFTWGGNCSLQNAVSALEAAIDQELLSLKVKNSGLWREIALFMSHLETGCSDS